MAPGSSNMLRARRRDANVKPNRRLDKKSSRGMLFENEELRMRTITINEEVEKGQSDIKKLRRENEQLRREIWGLRDEYDRLEEIVEDLKDDTDTEQEESDCDEDFVDEPELDPSSPENAENAVKEQQASVAGVSGVGVPARGKVEFDGLSIVDEETDELGTPSNNASMDAANAMGRFSSGAPSPSRIGWKYGNPANQQGPPGWKFGNAAKHFVFPPPVQETAPHTEETVKPNLEGRFFARMPSQVDEQDATLHDLYSCATLPSGGQYCAETDPGFCGTIILPNSGDGYYGDGGYRQDQYQENGMPAWEDTAWGGEPMVPNGQCITVLPETEQASGIGRIAFAYSYYGNKGSVLPSVVNGKLLTSIYNMATPVGAEGDVCYERGGPDLLMSSMYPLGKPGNSVEREGGDGNTARVDIIPEYDPELQKWSTSLDGPVGSTVASCEDQQRRPLGVAVNVKPPVPPKPVLIGARRRPSVQLTEVREGADPESSPVDVELDAVADDEVFHASPPLSLCPTSGVLSQIVSRRGRVGTPLQGEGQCEPYRQPPAFIRLNSIRPHTLVFSVHAEQVTVQEVIDALDAQLDLVDAVRGVRVVNRHCYICLARRQHVATLLAAGLKVRGVSVQLEDVSRGSCVVALAGVPHHVTDATVAVIMSNYGTVIGEVERRLYKGVDTGERLLRLKPSPLESQRMPPTILVAGAQVLITLLPPNEVTDLGYVGARENVVGDSSASYTNAPPPPPPVAPTTATSMDSSIDRFKTQLHVRLKTPEERFDTKLKYSTIPNKASSYTNPFGSPNNNYVLPPNFPFQELVHDARPINPNNPFGPNYNANATEHVNPTFNNYSPRGSPNQVRKHNEPLMTSPTLTRRTLAAHNACLGDANQVGLPKIQENVFEPDASYLHGAPSPAPNISQQNQSNAARSFMNVRDQGVPQHTRLGPHDQVHNPKGATEQLPLHSSSVPNSPSSPRRRLQKKSVIATRQRPSDEMVTSSNLSPVSPRHQTAPNSPNMYAKNQRNPRKMSNQSTNSNTQDSGDPDKTVPNATSSPLTKPKHGNRKLSVSINEGHAVDVSRSSSSGQDSPTKVERRRRVSIYFNNKKGSRRNSAVANGLIQRSASLDPVRCRFGNGSLDGGNEVTTTCSERERTNSVSSRGSSVGGKRKARRASLRTLEGADSEKLPWCGCWGNGCL